MDHGGDKDPRPSIDPSASPAAAHHDFSSTWSSCLAPDSSDGAYFFSDDVRDSNILSEFGWAIPAVASDSAGIAAPEPAPSATGGGGRDPAGPESSTSNHPSVSSDSSEDPAAEKSTGSGGNPPAETTPSKARKKGQKRIRQPRFAFMTKSEVDHLEDGYRWRKYGQKAVKNSPYPRSYYRCTNSKCTVKKRVERSSEDPTVVITTYEGQHCHHSVGFPRGVGGVITPNDAAAAFGAQLAPPQAALHLYNQARMHNLNPSPRGISNPPGLPSLPSHSASSGSESHLLHSDRPSRELRMHQSGMTNPPDFPTDEGLLGDIVPSGMRHR